MLAVLDALLRLHLDVAVVDHCICSRPVIGYRSRE